MLICVYCDAEIDDDSVFCPSCGSKITYGRTSQISQTSNAYSSAPRVLRVSNDQYNSYNSSYQNYNNNYNQNSYRNTDYQLKERTAGLTIVLVLNYIGIAILGLLSIILFLVNPFVGLIFSGFTGLVFWLIYSLQEYNNTARIIFLVLVILGSIINLTTLDIIPLLIGLFEIYVLAFDQQTVELFEEPRNLNRSSNPYSNYNNNFNRNY